jgi:ribosomal protein L16 Arg81 hydroxylase
MPVHTLAWLVAPRSLDDFLSRHWERAPLHIARRQPSYYADLFTLGDLDALVTRPRHHATLSTLELAKDGRRVARDEIATSAEKKTIDVLKVNRQMTGGSTLIMNDIDSMVPAVDELDARLARALTARVWANLYYTPAGNRGFDPHYDAHDVFILQVHGSKRWKLHGKPVGIPLPTRAFDPTTMKPGAVSRRLTLRCGDTLYIPKGLVHSAESAREASIHLTIAVESLTWADLLAEACTAWVDRDESLRRGLPPGFGLPDADHRPIADKLADAIQKMARRLDVRAALDRLHDRIATERRHSLSGIVEQTLRRGALRPDSIVGVRPGLLYRLTAKSSVLTLHARGAELSVPARHAGLLRFAVARERFAVRDLPGRLDVAAKLELVRDLIAEGVLRVLAFAPDSS